MFGHSAAVTLYLCDVVENRWPVDNSPGAAERAGEVYQRQEFSAKSDESEAGLSSLH